MTSEPTNAASDHRCEPDCPVCANRAEIKRLGKDMKPAFAATVDRSRAEYVRDVRARALRVLDGSQTGSYTKRHMAHDIERLVGLLEASPCPLGEVGEIASRYAHWHMDTFGAYTIRQEVFGGR